MKARIAVEKISLSKKKKVYSWQTEYFTMEKIFEELCLQHYTSRDLDNWSKLFWKAFKYGCRRNEEYKDGQDMLRRL